jgi:hypothetical protein
MRFLIAFCVGVTATLAWQSYGDAAREMIASSYPQLDWLAPQAAVAQTAPTTIPMATPSPDRQELRVMSFDLAALRQRVDEIAAGQDRIAISPPSYRRPSRTSLTRSRCLRRNRPLLRPANPRRHRCR